MNAPRSCLAPYAESMRDVHPDQGWEAARDAWHTHGLVLLNLAEVEQRRGWAAARQARNLAEQCFGKRTTR
jgi:hypothetical protein